MDQFLIENTVWKVLLSSGEQIISDNTYKHGKSDWERLRNYCRDNSFTIESMELAFRDHVISIPKAKYYFFRRMALCGFGKTTREKDTCDYFLVGSTNSPDKVHIKKYLTPELTVWEEEERLLDNDPSLI